ncbi:hypothetical protein Hanom_Chr00s000005g01612231 [Helianthus anomalus]
MAGEGKLQESQGNMSSHYKTFLFFIEFCSFEVSTTRGNMGGAKYVSKPRPNYYGFFLVDYITFAVKKVTAVVMGKPQLSLS